MSTTTTWTATSARSWRYPSDGGGSGGWRSENKAYQGQYSNFGLHKGLWFFDDASIRSTLSGQTILSIRLRLTRDSNGGVSGAQTPTIRPHNYSSQPSGEPVYASGTNTSESWGWGETDWVTLDNSWGRSLRDGHVRGVGVYTTSNSPYMIMDDVAVLEVTYEPTLTAPDTPPTPELLLQEEEGVELRSTDPGDVDQWEWDREGDGSTQTTNRSTRYHYSSIGPGQNDRYRVRHRNAAGVSAYSPWRAAGTPPATPTGLETSADTTEVTLTWSDQSLGDGGEWQVYRNGVLVHTTTTRGWTDTGRASSTRYSYQLRAANNIGSSSLTAVAYGYTKAPNPSAQKLVDVAHASTQLQDGTTIFAVVDGNGDYGLIHRDLAGTEVTLGTIDSSTIEVQALTRSGKLQSIAMTSDRVGNVYIVGARGSASNRPAFFALRRDSATTWTLQTVRSTTGAGLEDPQNFAVVWTDEGNGEGGEGRLLVTYSSGLTGQVGYFICSSYHPKNDQPLVLTASGTAPTFLVSSSAYGTMRGSGMALATDALGSARVGAIACTTSKVTGGNYDRVRLARVIVGTDVSLVSSENVSTSFPWVPGADRPTAVVVGYGGDEFAAVWSGPGDTIHVKPIGSGSVAHLGDSSPFHTEALAADYSDDDEAVFIYAFRGDSGAATIVRTPWFTATGAFGVEEEVVSYVTTSRSLRLPEAVVDGRYIALSYSYTTTSLITTTVAHNQPPLAPDVPAVSAFDAADAKAIPWTFNDPNPSDSQSAYEVQVERTDTGASVIATGKVVSGTESYTIAAGTLTNGVGYRVKVRTWDQGDEVGPWSTWRTFSPTASATVAITAPLPDAFIIVADQLVEWSYSHPSGTPQSEYRVRLMDGTTEVLTTGWVASANAFHQLNDLESGVYTLEVQVRTSGVLSNVAAQALTVDVDTPDEPFLVVDAREGYARVSIENPPPTGDRPLIEDNRVYRRLAGTNAWTRIAVGIGNSGNYDDYNVASGEVYEYKVRATAEGGGFIDSVAVSVTIMLEGVWLHDLVDPAGSLRQYRYQAGARKENYDAETELLHFAGRPFPVADYGEHGEQGVDVALFVPYGGDGIAYLRSVIERRVMVVYRDNRGRVMFAALHGLSLQDVAAGTEASFRVDRVNHEEAV